MIVLTYGIAAAGVDGPRPAVYPDGFDKYWFMAFAGHDLLLRLGRGQLGLPDRERDLSDGDPGLVAFFYAVGTGTGGSSARCSSAT